MLTTLDSAFVINSSCLRLLLLFSLSELQSGDDHRHTHITCDEENDVFCISLTRTFSAHRYFCLGSGEISCSPRARIDEDDHRTYYGARAVSFENFYKDETQTLTIIRSLQSSSL